MKLGLNEEVRKQIPEVEEVFLFDDDENSLILHSILKHPSGANLQYSKSVGLTSITKVTTAQVSVYTMPNGKKCAVAYPTSVRVHYDHFEKGISKIFKHVDRCNFSNNSYSFYLYCVKNGFVGNLKND